MISRLTFMAALLLALTACGTADAKTDNNSTDTDSIQAVEVLPDTALMITDSIPAGSRKVEVETTAGNFTLLLYGDTPRHRDNFLKLVKDSVYNGLLFHRVIKDFMVQAGDPESKNAPAGKMLGAGQSGPMIDAEIVYPRHFHKRGALAAARQGDQVNPERKSSGSQFYIVTGKTYTPQQLEQMDRQLRYGVAQQHFNALAREHMEEIRAMQAARDTAGLDNLQSQLADQTEKWLATQTIGMTPEMKETYQKIGGTPHLDNEYTVYGEVISGMDVIDRIQKVETGQADRPVEDVRIVSMKVLDD